MEYPNNFPFIEYELLRDVEEGPIVYRGDNLGILHGNTVIFTVKEILPDEELYALFEGTPGNFFIQLKDTKKAIFFKEARKELKPEETKLSFDFDGTLTKPDIQEYTKELVGKGYDIWIHTSRMKNNEDDCNYNWNDDLYKIAEQIGIPKEKIIFCAMVDKWKFLKEKNFIWHIDDDSIECNMINVHLKCRGICHFGSTTWKNKCKRLLK